MLIYIYTSINKKIYREREIQLYTDNLYNHLVIHKVIGYTTMCRACTLRALFEDAGYLYICIFNFLEIAHTNCSYLIHRETLMAQKRQNTIIFNMFIFRFSKKQFS